MPHVVLDTRMAWAAGIGTYIRNAFPRMARLQPNWHFTLLGDVEKLAGADWSRAPNVTHATCGAPIYSLREQGELVARVPRGADVYWAPHYNVPVLLRRPMVVTVHDMMHLRMPEHTRSAVRRMYARSMFGAVRWKADAIMCDSAFTRGEFEALLGATQTATVVHLGIDDAWFATESIDAPNGGAPYIVFVGDLKPHKNLPALLEAFRQVAARTDLRLLLIGRFAGFRVFDQRITPILESLGERVSVLGSVDDESLRRYVRHARALVAPSVYEGFGFPPLEAMAAGCPAIVARAGSLPEVCGDAAVYFDPANPNELADRLMEVVSDPDLRRSLTERGRVHARQFDWNVTATAIRDIVARVADNAS